MFQTKGKDYGCLLQQKQIPKIKSGKQSPPLLIVSGHSKQTELLLSDILGTQDDVVSKNMEQEAERKLLKTAIGKLGDRERVIIELRYGLGEAQELPLTQKEVADRLGISQSYISRIEKKIMGRLKKEMQKVQG